MQLILLSYKIDFYNLLELLEFRIKLTKFDLNTNKSFHYFHLIHRKTAIYIDFMFLSTL
jgi:hypothetical protein